MLVVRQRQESRTTASSRSTGPAWSLRSGGCGRVGKDCGWKHLRAPAVRKLWKEGATGAVLEILEDTPVGRRLSAGMARAPRGNEVFEGEMTESEEDGPGPP